MWGVDPRALCRQHLLGEHAELHQLAGTIAAHPHGVAIARGHAERGQIDTERIEARHDELVTEFDRRGFNHDSPLSHDDELSLGTLDVEANLEDLADRCLACRRRIERLDESDPAALNEESTG